MTGIIKKPINQLYYDSKLCSNINCNYIYIFTFETNNAFCSKAIRITPTE